MDQHMDETFMTRRTAPSRRFAAILTVVCVAISAPVAAQDGSFVVPTETQLQLFTQGSEAYQADDYEKAIKLFKASLLVGELNITYLNLGRAYFKLGQCKEAREAYAKVRKAPQVRQPPPESVLIRLNEYLVDLDEECVEGTKSTEPDKKPDEVVEKPEKGSVKIQVMSSSGEFGVKLKIDGAGYACPKRVTRLAPCIIQDLPPGDAIINVTGDLELAQAFRFTSDGVLVHVRTRSRKALTAGKWMMGIGGGLIILGIVVAAASEGDSLAEAASLSGLGTFGLITGGITTLVGIVIKEDGGINVFTGQ